MHAHGFVIYEQKTEFSIHEAARHTHTHNLVWKRAEHPKIFAKGFSGLELMELRREITDLHKHFQFFFIHIRFWRDLWSGGERKYLSMSEFNTRNAPSTMYSILSTFPPKQHSTTAPEMPLQLSREMITIFFFDFFPLNYLLFFLYMCFARQLQCYV